MRNSALILLFWCSAGLAGEERSAFLTEGSGALTTSDMNGDRAKWAQACSGPGGTTPFATAVCEHVAGVFDNSAGRLESAQAHYRKALALWEAMAPDRAAFHVTTIISLADPVAASGDLKEAEKLVAKAQAIAGTLEESAPQLVASAAGHAGAFYGRTSDPERGRPLLVDAIARFRRMASPVSRENMAELAYALNALGMIDLGSGHNAESETRLREAVTIAREYCGEAHPDTTGYQINLALVLDVEGRFGEAETLLRRARVVVERRNGADTLQAAAVLSELSSVEASLGKFGIAEDLAERTLAILRRDHAPDRPEVVLTQISLGTIYLREHKTVQAANILPGAVQMERRLAIDPRVLADGIRRLADLRAQQHDWEAARALYVEAIGIYERRLGTNHPDIAPVLRDYAEVLKQQGAPKAEVKTVEARARALGPRAAKGLLPPS